jgi:ribosomal protein S18 acetylase RimI-like enzyme
MKIRKAKREDLKEIVEVYKKVYSEKPYKEEWSNDVLSGKINEMLCYMKCYLAVEDSKIVGVIFYYYEDWWDGKKAYVVDFFILEEYRKRGFGKTLFEKVEESALEDSIVKIEFDVNVNAEAALGLYKKMGYSNSNYVKMEKKLR